MKKLTIISIALFAGIATTLIFNGCAATEKMTSKSGAQLWGENCIRCHNAPDPADYSDEQWAVVGTHMKLRVNTLTEAEVDKIVEFLQSAN